MLRQNSPGRLSRNETAGIGERLPSRQMVSPKNASKKLRFLPLYRSPGQIMGRSASHFDPFFQYQ
jgi:hypothetical protein